MNKVRHICTYLTVFIILGLVCLVFQTMPVSAESEPVDGDTYVVADEDTEPEPAPESVFKNGDGTEWSPYLITGIDDLVALRNYVNAGNTGAGLYFKLTRDIIIEGSWYPIGIYVKDDPINSKPFAGTFDGGRHEIKNLYISLGESAPKADDGVNGVGLFGNNAGTIKNLGIRKGSIKGQSETGSIAGANSGVIERCYNEFCSVDGRDRTGGIVGKNTGIIRICYNTGSIGVAEFENGHGSVGGITGDNGGIVENCYNTGSVSGKNFIGGVVGYNSDGGNISNSYNIGVITAVNNAGGVTGVNTANTKVTSCFYLENCVTSENDKLDDHGTPISKIKFEDRDMFENEEGWNFFGIWVMQTTPGDVRPVFGYHREVPSGNIVPGHSGSSNDWWQGSGGGSMSWGGGGGYPGLPATTTAAVSDSTETSETTEETEASEEIEEAETDDVSSGAGAFENGQLLENSVPVIAIAILTAVSSVFIIKLRRRKG